MLYLHQWYRSKKLDRNRYAHLVEDVQVLFSRLEEVVRDLAFLPGKGSHDPLGQDEPLFTGDSMKFSFGTHSFRDWRDWETSQLWVAGEEDKRSYEYTTQAPTRHSPYALLVCTILLACKHHFPETSIESQAPPILWTQAVDWYHACFPDRLVLPGPWSQSTTRLPLDNLALLDHQAQHIGYRVSREEGMLFLIYKDDDQNSLMKNQVFTDDPQGRRELAGWLHWLKDIHPLIFESELGWEYWNEREGILGKWTPQLYELLSENEVLDLRKIEAKDGTYAWVPRRALSTLLGSPQNLKQYRFILLKEGTHLAAVRVEERASGYDRPSNPYAFDFFPLCILRAVTIVDPVPHMASTQPGEQTHE